MAATGATTRPSLGPGWFRLSAVLGAALRLTVLAHVANVAFSVWAWDTFTRWQEDLASADVDQAALYDRVVVVAAGSLTIAHVTLAALFIPWLALAHRSDRMDPARLQHGSGWAVGGWFVPVLNLWRPYQMVEDVRLGSGTGVAPTSNVVLWWWLALLAAWFTDRVTVALLPDASASDDQYFGSLARANLSDAIASGVYVVAAALAVAVVAEVTRLVRESPHSPHPPAPATVA